MTESYSFTTLNMPGADSTQAFGINNSGQIVGQYNQNTGFLYSNGAFSSPPGISTSNIIPDAINDSGEIIAYTYGYGYTDING